LEGLCYRPAIVLPPGLEFLLFDADGMLVEIDHAFVSEGPVYCPGIGQLADRLTKLEEGAT